MPETDSLSCLEDRNDRFWYTTHVPGEYVDSMRFKSTTNVGRVSHSRRPIMPNAARDCGMVSVSPLLCVAGSVAVGDESLLVASSGSEQTGWSSSDARAMALCCEPAAAGGATFVIGEARF